MSTRDACLRRSWLIARLAGHIEIAWSARRGDPSLLSLADAELIAALGGAQRDALAEEYARFDPAHLRRRCAASGIAAFCRCDPAYPAPLTDLIDAPAVLYVHGEPARFAQTLGAD